MTESEIQEVMLTPKQRRRAGQIHRSILSWRRERKNRIGKLSGYEWTERKSLYEQIISEPVGSVESEV